MADPKALGKSFVDQLLARVDPAQRDAVASALANDAIYETAGAREAELVDWHGELTGYHNKIKNHPALQTPNPTPVAAAGVSKDDVVKLIGDEMRGAASYVNEAIHLGIGHGLRFNEVLDVNALITDPDVQRIGVRGVYDKKYGAKIQEMETAAAKKRADDHEAQIRADERARVMKERGSDAPYPVGRKPEPSVLDGINAPDRKVAPSVSVDELSDAFFAEVDRINAGARA